MCVIYTLKYTPLILVTSDVIWNSIRKIYYRKWFEYFKETTIVKITSIGKGINVFLYNTILSLGISFIQINGKSNLNSYL